MEWFFESMGICSWLLLILLILLAVYYYHLTAHFGYLEKQGVSVEKPWPILGTINLKKHLKDLDGDAYKQFGRFYGVYDGRMPGIHIGEPELLRQVLIKDFWTFPHIREMPAVKGDTVAPKFLMNLRGEEWKRVRNIMTPAFTTGKLKQMTSLIEDCCKGLQEYLDKLAEDGKPFDARKAVSCVTMDVIASCAFGYKIDSISDPENEFVKQSNKLFQPPFVIMAILILFPALLHYIPAKVLQIIQGADPLQFFKKLIIKIMALKKTDDHQARRDFLELLFEAKLENNEALGCELDENTSKQSLSDDIIIAQCILFLLAGHETTATAVSFALYNLVLNPDIQDRLANEVDEIMDECNDKISYGAIAKMQYLDMVLSETLRMYPPAVRVERTCVQDGYELNGVRLMKGMLIGIPVYSIHHDPEFYPDPETFDPERFNAENKAARDPVTYLPFGVGPRNCIGMRFALLEAKMTLAMIIRKFRVKRCSETQVPLKFVNMTTFLQSENLMICIEKRVKNRG